jgi:hypothetical protein
MVKYLKQEVAEKEALEMKKIYGGSWSVIKYQYEYDIARTSAIANWDQKKVVYTTGH